LLVFCFGFLYGLLYIYLIPPWQHHDEPSHFEYVWMIAQTGKIPEKNTYDNTIRLQILESMKRNNFFIGKLAEVGETAADQNPVWIGVTQVGDPPLYYWLEAQVLRMAEGQSIESQLYAMRWFSLAMLMGVLVTAWQFTRELTPPDHPLQWIMPLSLALVPPFMEHNTALNNDVAATLVFSLILLFGVRLIRGGWRLANVLVLVVLLALSTITKGSIWLAVLVVPLAFYFTALRRFSPWLSLGGLVLAGLLVVLAVFDFNDAALWLRQTHQPEPTRVKTSLGWSYQLCDQTPGCTSALYQIIPDRPELHGGEVTLGAWMWGSPGQLAYPPSLMVLDKNYQNIFFRPQPVVLQDTPTFYTASYELPEQFLQLFLLLDPQPAPEISGRVYYWRPVMASGLYYASDALYLAPDANSGTWRGETFKNLARNSALNQTWPKFKPSMITLFESIDPRISEAANWVIYSLDTEGAGWYTRKSAERLFNSFWASYGWGNTILTIGMYRLLVVCSLIGLAAGFVAFMALPKDRALLLAWLGFAILCLLFFAWFTGISSRTFTSKPSFPDARYIQPVAIPLIMVFSSGWYALIHLLLQRWRWAGLGGYFLFLLWLNAFTLSTILNYFYP
jgi:hypothetical protein